MPSGEIPSYARLSAHLADTTGKGGFNTRSVTTNAVALAALIGGARWAKGGRPGFGGILRAVGGALLGVLVGGFVAWGAWAVFDKARKVPPPPSPEGDRIRSQYAGS